MNQLNYWFKWNEVKSTDYGIYIAEQPNIIKPAERVSYITIPGRSGSLTQLQGEDVYEDITLTVECFIADITRIDEIGEYLSGNGILELAARPGGYFRGRIAHQIDFKQILRGHPNRSFSVVWRLEPFWRSKTTSDIKLTTNGSVINPGTTFAYPIITVACNGSGTLIVGETAVVLSDVPSKIILNGTLQEAYSDTVSLNDCMTGDFPKLLPGSNVVRFNGDITSVEISAEWRYLI